MFRSLVTQLNVHREVLRFEVSQIFILLPNFLGLSYLVDNIEIIFKFQSRAMNPGGGETSKHHSVVTDWREIRRYLDCKYQHVPDEYSKNISSCCTVLHITSGPYSSINFRKNENNIMVLGIYVRPSCCRLQNRYISYIYLVLEMS